MISASAIQFKGSGWYVTDYAGKSKGSDGGKEEKAAGEAKESGTKESGAKESAGKESSSKDSGTKDSGGKEKKAEKSGKKK